LLWQPGLYERIDQGEIMPPVIINVQGITPDLLQTTDSLALTDVLQAAISPSQPIVDGAGFDNRAMRDSKTKEA
jgi:hypothetical protein